MININNPVSFDIEHLNKYVEESHKIFIKSSLTRKKTQVKQGTKPGR